MRHFYAISRQYEISITALRELNNLSEKDGLSIGQELVVAESNSPPQTPENASQIAENQYVVHTVMPGETLYSIARDHKATIKDLMEWK